MTDNGTRRHLDESSRRFLGKLIRHEARSLLLTSHFATTLKTSLSSIRCHDLFIRVRKWSLFDVVLPKISSTLPFHSKASRHNNCMAEAAPVSASDIHELRPRRKSRFRLVSNLPWLRRSELIWIISIEQLSLIPQLRRFHRADKK